MNVVECRSSYCECSDDERAHCSAKLTDAAHSHLIRNLNPMGKITSKTLPYFAARLVHAMTTRLRETVADRPYQFTLTAYHSEAPSTLEGLYQAAKEGLVPISCEDSHTAIYGATGNYIFRSYHDAGHLHHMLETTLSDELKLSQLQWADILYLIPEEDKWPCNLIWQADTAGQSWLHELTGAFPTNQTAFVLAITKLMQHGTLNIKDAVSVYVNGRP